MKPFKLFLPLLLLPLSGCFSFNKMSVPLFPEETPLIPYTIGGNPEASETAVFLQIEGIMLDTEQKGLLGLTGMKNTAAHVRAVLDQISGDPSVRALVLRINTPGGTVTAADLIHHEIMDYRARHPQVPVHAVMLDLATSGGYYAAVAANKIWAHPTTVTGSIGVIVQGINLAGLFKKVGLEDSTIKSGTHKDLLSPLRPQTDEDRRIVQGVVDALFERFVERVKEGRAGLSMEKIRQLADGRVFSAEQAKREGLIDEIGYFDDVLEALQRETGAPSLRAIAYRSQVEMNDNLYVAAGPNACPAASLSAAWLQLLSGSSPGGSPFLYMWPGATALPQ